MSPPPHFVLKAWERQEDCTVQKRTNIYKLFIVRRKKQTVDNNGEKFHFDDDCIIMHPSGRRILLVQPPNETKIKEWTPESLPVRTNFVILYVRKEYNGETRQHPNYLEVDDEIDPNISAEYQKADSRCVGG